jgi:hypothetical protein
MEEITNEIEIHFFSQKGWNLEHRVSTKGEILNPKGLEPLL